MSRKRKYITSRMHRIKPRKTIFKRLWFWFMLLIILIIFATAYVLLFYPNLQLKDVLVSGNNKVKTADLQKLAFNDSNIELINFWNIRVTSKSVLLINAQKIKNDILEKFPTVGDITINKKLPQTIIIGVSERSPIGTFCPLGGANKDSSSCFLIDQNGVIFEKTPDVSGPIMIVRQSSENIKPVAGQNVVSKEIINAIYKIQKMLRTSFHIEATEAIIASTDRLNITTDQTWKAYFDLSNGSDINLQITKLNLLLSGGMSLSEKNALKYVDLRPKDRAIICADKICGG